MHKFDVEFDERINAVEKLEKAYPATKAELKLEVNMLLNFVEKVCDYTKANSWRQNLKWRCLDSERCDRLHNYEFEALDHPVWQKLSRLINADMHYQGKIQKEKLYEYLCAHPEACL